MPPVPGPRPQPGPRALARYRALAPHLHDGVSLAAAAAGVAYRTAQRRLAAYRAGGLAALDKAARSDKGQWKIPDDLMRFVEGLALRKPPVPTTVIHRRAAGRERGTRELIPYTLPEVRRLRAALAVIARPITHIVHWSLWRRRRQRQAQVSRFKARGYLAPP